MAKGRLLTVADLILVPGRDHRPSAAKAKRLAKVLKAGGSLPPILVTWDLYVIDGYHRVAAHELAGVEKILAYTVVDIPDSEVA